MYICQESRNKPYTEHKNQANRKPEKGNALTLCIQILFFYGLRSYSKRTPRVHSSRPSYCGVTFFTPSHRSPLVDTGEFLREGQLLHKCNIAARVGKLQKA